MAFIAATVMEGFRRCDIVSASTVDAMPTLTQSSRSACRYELLVIHKALVEIDACKLLARHFQRNSAMVFSYFFATFSAIFSAMEVLPMPGRAAISSRSDLLSPLIFLSRCAARWKTRERLIGRGSSEGGRRRPQNSTDFFAACRPSRPADAVNFLFRRSRIFVGVPRPRLRCWDFVRGGGGAPRRSAFSCTMVALWRQAAVGVSRSAAPDCRCFLVPPRRVSRICSHHHRVNRLGEYEHDVDGFKNVVILLQIEIVGLQDVYDVATQGCSISMEPSTPAPPPAGGMTRD